MSTEPTGDPMVNPTSAATSSIDRHLDSLGLSRDNPPDRASWTALLDLVEAADVPADNPNAEIEALLAGEVEQNRSSYANLFERSPVPILEIDLTRVAAALGSDGSHSPLELLDLVAVTAGNPAAAAMIGVPVAGLMGPLPSMLRDLASVDGWLPLRELIDEGKTTSEAELTTSRPDGTPIDLMVTLSVPTPFDIPDYSRVVASLVDFTARKTEERRMQALVNAKNQLMASVGHEIRTPLTGVIGFAELLKADSVTDPAERRSFVTAIADHATDVANIVEDLMVAARLELDELPVAGVRTNLTAQVAQVIESGGALMSKVRTPSRNVEDRAALADPGRVRQIIRNLVSNAVRYGGPEVTIKIRRRVNTLYLTVSDNGDGLSEDEVRRIFQTDESARTLPTQPGAMGIGLTISRALALRMNGDLAYRQEDGLTVFELSLPTAEDH